MPTVRETNRWRGISALSLLAGGVGLLADRPTLLVLAVVGVVFAVYPRLLSAPAVDLELERRLETLTPGFGEDVEVTVSVTNVGTRPLFDLRIVDGVPPALAVTAGSPRCGLVLRRDETRSFTYSVEASHGTHSFEPATAVVRDPSGAFEVETTVATETELVCRALPADAHLRRRTVESIGQVATNRGGRGIEFFGAREYRHGDPLSQFDWNRYARTREQTTIEYRAEQAASVAIIVDARAAAYRGVPDQPHAVTYSVAAAEDLLEGLLDCRNNVGLAALGRRGCWLAPSRGPQHRVQARKYLMTHAAFGSKPPAEDEDVPLDEQVTELLGRLSSTTQVVLLTPLCDADIGQAARRLEVHGHHVTVISPDVTGSETVGQRLAAVDRENCIAGLRAVGIPVVEWRPTVPLAAALVDRGPTAPEVPT